MLQRLSNFDHRGSEQIKFCCRNSPNKIQQMQTSFGRAISVFSERPFKRSRAPSPPPPSQKADCYVVLFALRCVHVGVSWRRPLLVFELRTSAMIIALVTVATVMLTVLLQTVLYSLATAKFKFHLPLFWDSCAFSNFYGSNLSGGLGHLHY